MKCMTCVLCTLAHLPVINNLLLRKHYSKCCMSKTLFWRCYLAIFLLCSKDTTWVLPIRIRLTTTRRHPCKACAWKASMCHYFPLLIITVSVLPLLYSTIVESFLILFAMKDGEPYVQHKVQIFSVRSYVKRYLGVDMGANWRAFCETRVRWRNCVYLESSSAIIVRWWISTD